VIGAVAAASVGLFAGLFFFGTLWWTVRRLRKASRPHLLLVGSLLLRAAVVLVAFYALAARGLWAIVPAALGFVLARNLLVRRIGPSPKEVSAEKAAT
jgi:F1F0 ATPase subunit 2